MKLAEAALQTVNFDPAAFEQHVKRWKEIQDSTCTALVESHPWGYLAKVGHNLDKPTRTHLMAQLAILKLPDVTVVLTTTGREIARRQGHQDIALNEFGTKALREMRELMLLPGTVITADVTPTVPITAAKFTRMLNSRLFSVKTTTPDAAEAEACAVEGM